MDLDSITFYRKLTVLISMEEKHVNFYIKAVNLLYLSLPKLTLSYQIKKPNSHKYESHTGLTYLHCENCKDERRFFLDKYWSQMTEI